MYKSLMVGSVAPVVCAGLATPLLAADPFVVPADTAMPVQPAEVCVAVLRAV